MIETITSLKFETKNKYGIASILLNICLIYLPEYIYITKTLNFYNNVKVLAIPINSLRHFTRNKS